LRGLLTLVPAGRLDDDFILKGKYGVEIGLNQRCLRFSLPFDTKQASHKSAKLGRHAHQQVGNRFRFHTLTLRGSIYLKLCKQLRTTRHQLGIEVARKIPKFYGIV